MSATASRTAATPPGVGVKDGAGVEDGRPVHAFRPDGGVFDLMRLAPADIDFAAMAGALSKIARFNGVHRGQAYSVAQHSVMGADALFAETGDGELAGHFLLHDGHEWLLGDWTRPAMELLDRHVAMMLARTFDGAAEGWAGYAREAMANACLAADAVILEAAGLPPTRLRPAHARAVRDMDDRMLRAEAIALFGPRAARHLPAANRPAPKLTGAIRPWGAAKAEEAFLDRLERYCGVVVR